MTLSQIQKGSRIYLALGDSMSIDEYTGVKGGGAVNQFHKSLGSDWKLIDRSSDGLTMPWVRWTVKRNCDLITLTIGGNDLLLNQDYYLRNGLSSFAGDHFNLLQPIRRKNPDAIFIVGNVYTPRFPLSGQQEETLAEANSIIERNVQGVEGKLADIQGAFRGHEDEYLCLEIEPTMEGATTIAELFWEAFLGANQARSDPNEN